MHRGVNANVLRKWIKLHQQRLSDASTQSSTAESAFVPVVMVSSEQALVERKSVMSSSLAATANFNKHFHVHRDSRLRSTNRPQKHRLIIACVADLLVFSDQRRYD
ncbi:hypothetical protein LJR230_004888 [Trinickia sp. LjRoot230]